MASSSRPGALGYDSMRDVHWSSEEKIVARKAFDRALQRELESVMVEAKKGLRGSSNRPTSGIWSTT